MRPRKTDKRAIDDNRSQAGMTAEHHEPKAPALTGDKNAERQQQGTSADNAKNVCRAQPQRPADDIALLASRGER
jgi:hypothetical protein